MIFFFLFLFKLALNTIGCSVVCLTGTLVSVQKTCTIVFNKSAFQSCYIFITLNSSSEHHSKGVHCIKYNICDIYEICVVSE